MELLATTLPPLLRLLMSTISSPDVHAAARTLETLGRVSSLALETAQGSAGIFSEISRTALGDVAGLLTRYADTELKHAEIIEVARKLVGGDKGVSRFVDQSFSCLVVSMKTLYINANSKKKKHFTIFDSFISLQ